MSVSIINTIKTIDEYLKQNIPFSFRVLKKYVFFDKDGAPYLALLKKLPVSKYDDYDLDFADQGYQIFVYPFSHVKNGLRKKFVASAIICVSANEARIIGQEIIYLSRIWIADQDYKQKGIGSNLLKIIDLFAVNEKKDFVCGYFAPFGFMSGNLKQVKKFYNKSFYKVLNDKESARKPFSYDLVKEVLGAKSTKLVTINFPTKKFDFTVIVPKEQIFSSSYRGMTEDKN
ncbi:MAG: hypothetical protein ACOX6H_03040 [Christensenellales bacterium]|jgi:hypothetical protein